MLVAPSCHNVYLSPKQSQHKASNASSSSASKTSEGSASNNSNFLKNAFNKGFSFFSKIASSSGSPATTTSASTSSKPAGSDEHDSSSSETPSDCSSPDSLKIELGQFKPITREPKTPSSVNSKVVRVPTVRSVSTSTEFVIRSPCPSPFVPITPRRMSAFSLVKDFEYEKPTLAKPEAKKRKGSGPIQPPAKKTRKEVQATKKSPQKARSGAKKESTKSKVETTTEILVRKTRSMDLKEAKDVDCPKPEPEKKKVLQAPPAKKASPKKRGKVPAAAKTAPASTTRSLRARN